MPMKGALPRSALTIRNQRNTGGRGIHKRECALDSVGI
jgi:hypothetical protein